MRLSKIAGRLPVPRSNPAQAGGERVHIRDAKRRHAFFEIGSVLHQLSCRRAKRSFRALAIGVTGLMRPFDKCLHAPGLDHVRNVDDITARDRLVQPAIVIGKNLLREATCSIEAVNMEPIDEHSGEVDSGLVYNLEFDRLIVDPKNRSYPILIGPDFPQKLDRRGGKLAERIVPDG